MGLIHEYLFQHSPEGLVQKQGSWSFSQVPCFVVYEEAEGIIFDLAEQTTAEVGFSYREHYASNQYAFAERWTLLLQTKFNAADWLTVLCDGIGF